MNIFTVSLFGHREISDLKELSSKIEPIIKKLLQTKLYVSFLIGRNGEFDEYIASLIKLIQRKTGKENSEINLILPYKVTNIEFYEKYYDSVIIPNSVYGAYHKAAITIKNRWMVEKSDFVIGFVKSNKGGAYTAMKYAQKLDKKILNIARI